MNRDALQLSFGALPHGGEREPTVQPGLRFFPRSGAVLMVLSSDSLEAQLLRLPLGDGAWLAEFLLMSLETDADPDVEAAWAVEVERRLRELQAGTVAGVPAAEVFARVATRLQG